MKPEHERALWELGELERCEVEYLFSVRKPIGERDGLERRKYCRRSIARIRALDALRSELEQTRAYLYERERDEARAAAVRAAMFAQGLPADLALLIDRWRLEQEQKAGAKG